MRDCCHPARVYAEQAVAEIDQGLTGVQLFLPNVLQIRDDLLVRLRDNTHLDELRIVLFYKALDHAFEHVLGVELVHASVVDVFQQRLFAAVPDKQVFHILPDVPGQERRNDIGFSVVVEADEVRMLHLGSVEGAVAGLDAFLDRRFPVILPLPFLPHQGGGAEDPVDHVRIRAGTECDHGAERAVGLGLGAVI